MFKRDIKIFAQHTFYRLTHIFENNIKKIENYTNLFHYMIFLIVKRNCQLTFSFIFQQ